MPSNPQQRRPAWYDAPVVRRLHGLDPEPAEPEPSETAEKKEFK